MSLQSTSGLPVNLVYSPPPNMPVPLSKVIILTTTTTALTLTAQDSGSIIGIPNIANAVPLTITLPNPAVAAGCFYRAILSATQTGGQVLRLDGGAGLMQGVVAGTAAAVDLTAGAASRYVQFAATAKKGDWIEVLSDGTFWYAEGVSSLAGANGIAFA